MDLMKLSSLNNLDDDLTFQIQEYVTQADIRDTTTRNIRSAVEEFQFLSLAIIVPITSFIGILLNILNIFILRNKIQFPESSYAYLFSLALADLFTLCFFFVNSFGRSFHRESLDWRRFEIFGYFPVGSMTSNASVLLTVVVTIERFVFMYKPFLSKSYCTRRFARKIIAGIWIFCTFINIPRFFVMNVSPNGNLSFTRFGRSTFYKVVSWMYTILFAIASSVCLVVFNSLLIYAIHKRRTTLHGKKFSTLFSQDEFNNDVLPINKSVSCNALNRFGCSNSQILNVDGLKASQELYKKGDKMKLKREKSKSIEAMELKFANSRNKTCKQILDSRRGTMAAINLRFQQKQKEDFGLTLTLIGVVILFLIGELPSAFLSRNIVGPLFGDEVLVNDNYMTANTIATVLVVVQHSTNFVIYYILNHKFCAAVKKHFARILKMMTHKC